MLSVAALTVTAVDSDAPRHLIVRTSSVTTALALTVAARRCREHLQSRQGPCRRHPWPAVAPFRWIEGRAIPASTTTTTFHDEPPPPAMNRDRYRLHSPCVSRSDGGCAVGRAD